MQNGENCGILIKLTRSVQFYPGVAKFGIALEWGSRGLEFESRHSDQRGSLVTVVVTRLPLFLRSEKGRRGAPCGLPRSGTVFRTGASPVPTQKGANPMKTPEELNALKEEVETVSRKLAELTEEELAQVSGGWITK